MQKTESNAEREVPTHKRYSWPRKCGKIWLLSLGVVALKQQINSITKRGIFSTARASSPVNSREAKTIGWIWTLVPDLTFSGTRSKDADVEHRTISRPVTYRNISLYGVMIVMASRKYQPRQTPTVLLSSRYLIRPSHIIVLKTERQYSNPGKR